MLLPDVVSRNSVFTVTRSSVEFANSLRGVAGALLTRYVASGVAAAHVWRLPIVVGL